MFMHDTHTHTQALTQALTEAGHVRWTLGWRGWLCKAETPGLVNHKYELWKDEPVCQVNHIDWL